MLIVNKAKPNNLLSGHIAKVLNVGEINNKLTKKNAFFLFLFNQFRDFKKYIVRINDIFR